MSPSLPERLVKALLPDRLGIGLFPDRLLFARTSGGLRRRVRQMETLSLAPAAQDEAIWQPAVDALAGCLAAGELANTRVTLVLSNHFVRYVVVPGSEELASQEEEEGYARHCLERVYGGGSESWALKLSGTGAKHARIACAIEQPLISALSDRLSSLKGRYLSLQPHLMASFNRVRSFLGAQPAWLVVAEPGLVCLAHLREGQWQSVSALKVGTDWIEELAGLIAREECLLECECACERVLVVAPDAPGAALPQNERWRFEALLPRAVPGLGAGDASYGIALGT